MAQSVTYHLGGYLPAAPQQNRAELYDGTAGTYTAWDTSGNVTSTRPLTAGEVSMLAAQDTATTQQANSNTVTANVLAAQAQIKTWIANNPTGAVLTGPQTLQLAKMLNGVCKILLQQFSDTTGT